MRKGAVLPVGFPLSHKGQRSVLYFLGGRQPGLGLRRHRRLSLLWFAFCFLLLVCILTQRIYGRPEEDTESAIGPQIPCEGQS